MKTAFQVFAGLLLLLLPASAQEWPSRPITFVVSFAAGSGDDLLARILGPALSELLGQQIVVENVGGAGGMSGVNRVAKAAPDGYQVILGGTGTFAANQTLYKHPLYNALTDFEPVALMLAESGMMQARVPQIAYAPVWCAWGYEREFTVAQILDTLPKARELGLLWAGVDDGWQTAEGDWNLDARKFPRGDADMRAKKSGDA